MWHLYTYLFIVYILALIDFKYYIIPDVAIFLIFLLAIFSGEMHFLGLLFGTFYYFYSVISILGEDLPEDKNNGGFISPIGGGDIKFLWVSGFYLGISSLMLMYAFAIIFDFIYISLKFLYKIISKKDIDIKRCPLTPNFFLSLIIWASLCPDIFFKDIV